MDTLENKRRPGRERRFDPSHPSYRPIPLLSMDPRQLTYTTEFKQEALRTWLLERRALLQKLREDVTKDRVRLQHETACLDGIPARVAERIDTLRRMASTSSDVPPLWDVATLLEQDILCL
ncbi:hypothetical protein MPSI1_002442 [Malassezia psittaci]|uniref:Uncharacterized protein n=1 Tax=Malassezia psittaci TaxID=1821823 RepID=A0AAF0FFL8_9BASI|nr:hypothetical protein MPSI1_002442 [Malassezia psittaci]